MLSDQNYYKLNVCAKTITEREANYAEQVRSKGHLGPENKKTEAQLSQCVVLFSFSVAEMIYVLAKPRQEYFCLASQTLPGPPEATVPEGETV